MSNEHSSTQPENAGKITDKTIGVLYADFKSEFQKSKDKNTEPLTLENKNEIIIKLNLLLASLKNSSSLSQPIVENLQIQDSEESRMLASEFLKTITKFFQREQKRREYPTLLVQYRNAFSILTKFQRELDLDVPDREKLSTLLDEVEEETNFLKLSRFLAGMSHSSGSKPEKRT